MHTNMPPGLLHNSISVNIWEKTQTKSFRTWRVCESINSERWLRSMESFTNARVKFIIRNWAPKRRFCVCNWLYVQWWTWGWYQWCVCNPSSSQLFKTQPQRHLYVNDSRLTHIISAIVIMIISILTHITRWWSFCTRQR